MDASTPMPANPPQPRDLRVLLVEDSEDDAQLLLWRLRKGGFAPQALRVDTAAALERALGEAAWDVVISDFMIPGFGGFEALALVQHHAGDLPFIMVSGHMGEELAVQAMKAGAHDYVMKGNLTRLIPAIERELTEAGVRRERRRAEALSRAQYEQMRALRAVDMAITSSSDLRVVLNVLAEKTTSALHVDAAALLRLNPLTQKLEFAAGAGFRTEALRFTHLRLGEGHAGLAALDRRTVHVRDLQRSPGLLERSPLLVQEGFVEYFAAPLIARGQVRGMLEVFQRRPFEPDQAWLDFLETLAGEGAIAIDNACMLEDLQHSNLELTLAYDATIEGWARTLELRDLETKGHTRRVTEMTVTLSRQLGFGGQELTQLRRGAILHDIGKLAIPDAILLKPGPLTPDEWHVMRRHPVIAHQLLSSIPFLRQAIEIPYAHHERVDGSGYPRGLCGDEIPMSARIFGVVDVWDALRSERPYKPAWPDERVRAHLAEEAGRHFDGVVVQALLALAWPPAAGRSGLGEPPSPPSEVAGHP